MEIYQVKGPSMARRTSTPPMMLHGQLDSYAPVHLWSEHFTAPDAGAVAQSYRLALQSWLPWAKSEKESSHHRSATWSVRHGTESRGSNPLLRLNCR